MMVLHKDTFVPPMEFERLFDHRETVMWMQQNWWLSIPFGVLYVALVFFGVYYRRQRPQMDLRVWLFLWSLMLAVFSIAGALRTVPYMFHVLLSGGFRRSVCDQRFYTDPVSSFWAYAFVLSKAPELGDTAFNVLRKKKLLFLHWFHHMTTLIYSWYGYKEMVAGGGWFMTMNFTIHAFMYSYYTLRAAGVRVPRAVNVVITSLQIAQMVMGLFVCVLVHNWMPQGDCPSSVSSVAWGGFMYLSYLLLFVHFFYKTYIRPTNVSHSGETAKIEKIE